MKMSKAKQFVKDHPRLLSTARLVLGKQGPSKNGDFYSIGEATAILTKRLTDTVPNEFDCIVGVPRAGLLFANILASCYGAKLASPQGFVRGEIWDAQEKEIAPRDIRSVLVVEDSVVTTNQLCKVAAVIRAARPDVEVKTLSLFQTSFKEALSTPDYVMLKNKAYTLGEWNLLTSLFSVGPLAVDMDGVLCDDCTSQDNDDGPAYLRFLAEAKPKYIPRFPIKAVVTSRFERYRPQTEAWLKRYGVKYQSLIMMSDRVLGDRTFGAVVDFKAASVAALGVKWYWESDDAQAQRIAKSAMTPTLSIEGMRLYRGV